MECKVSFLVFTLVAMMMPGKVSSADDISTKNDCPGMIFSFISLYGRTSDRTVNNEIYYLQ